MLAQFYNEANYIEAARNATRMADYNEGRAAGRIETTRDAVLSLFDMNMPVNDIAKVFRITEDQVLAIKTANMHL